jgi:hypothetical protein
MEINFLWPRNAAVGAQNPPMSALPNLTLGGLNLGPITGPIGNIPVFEATLGLILIVGAIYYVIAQRNAPPTVQPTQAMSQANA